MPKGLLFWILMILWLLFGLWGNWPAAGEKPQWGPFAGGLLLFVLLFLLGWGVFGFVIR